MMKPDHKALRGELAGGIFMMLVLPLTIYWLFA